VQLRSNFAGFAAIPRAPRGLRQSTLGLAWLMSALVSQVLDGEAAGPVADGLCHLLHRWAATQEGGGWVVAPGPACLPMPALPSAAPRRLTPPLIVAPDLTPPLAAPGLPPGMGVLPVPLPAAGERSAVGGAAELLDEVLSALLVEHGCIGDHATGSVPL
jgi:hypothetical protein